MTPHELVYGHECNEKDVDTQYLPLTVWNIDFRPCKICGHHIEPNEKEIGLAILRELKKGNEK